MCDREQLRDGIKQLDLSIADDAVDKLLRYCQELQKWSRNINLIARDTPAAEIVEKHFLDSLTLLPLLRRHSGPSASLLDVGSGAGFPGLVLAAALPELSVTLLEPRQKRAAFLRHVIRTLALGNVQVRAERLEPRQALPEQFTFITSRAVAAPAAFLSLLEQSIDLETLVILMQAEDDRQLLTACPDWEIVDSLQLRLPFSKHPRSLTAVRRQC
jgi:16S rRNA (guanine527-N7)-methyltransferase